MLAFLLGLVLGTNIGILLAALLFMSNHGSADEPRQGFRRGHHYAATRPKGGGDGAP